MYERRWFVLVTVGVGTLLSSLNTSMTNTILPVMERDLHIQMGQSEWIVLIYLLVLTLLLLPMGRFADLFGYRGLFLSGFVVYMGAAMLCGVSGNYALLLVGRVFLGVAGAMILSVGPALISTSFPPEQRGQVLGLQAVMTYIGLSAGPVLGGWITVWLGWPFTFYVTLPFAVLGLVLGLWCVPHTQSSAGRFIDIPGILLFILMMGSITVLFNAGAIVHGQVLWLVLLLASFALSLVFFVRVEGKQPAPMIQLTLFRLRDFGFGTVGAAFNYLCFFLVLFLLPYYFSTQLQASAAVTGSYLTISPAIMMICAPIAGRLSDKMGVRYIVVFGMLISALSLVDFAWLGSGSTTGGLARVWLVLGLVLAGLGTGSFAAPNNSAILSAAPREQQGVASGTLATFRYIGMMAGITLGGSLFPALMGPSPSNAAFLHAFSFVMWTGAVAGGLGVCSAWQVGRQPTRSHEHEHHS